MFLLGRLERQVLDILWTRGESNVRDVAAKLDRPLAYTTVMTTLDRLFKKGLLDRRKVDRAFLYSTCDTRQEWQGKQVGDFFKGFLRQPRASSELLISHLVDAAGSHDPALLDELEKKIRLKRKELGRKP